MAANSGQKKHGRNAAIYIGGPKGGGAAIVRNPAFAPAPLLKKFGDATIPLAEQIHTLQRQIQNLRRTRDLLLPRLLSGQVNLKGN